MVSFEDTEDTEEEEKQSTSPSLTKLSTSLAGLFFLLLPRVAPVTARVKVRRVRIVSFSF
jgi:hypothetical protein